MVGLWEQVGVALPRDPGSHSLMISPQTKAKKYSSDIQVACVKVAGCLTQPKKEPAGRAKHLLLLVSPRKGLMDSDRPKWVELDTMRARQIPTAYTS